jgi:hypothetical protein
MFNALIMMGMMATVGGIIVLLDWLGRRKARQSKRHHAA